MKLFKSVLLVVLSALTNQVHGFASPVSVAIVPPVQFPPSSFSITGARVSVLWGRHRDLYGIDLGLVGNITDQEFVGIGIAGGFNVTGGNTTALAQIAGIANLNSNKTDIYGLQFAGLINKNDAAASVTGLQFAAINLAPHTVIRGLQAGIYNRAQTVYGLQVGLINVTDSLYGLQIGLANFHNKGLFVISPIINFGF